MYDTIMYLSNAIVHTKNCAKKFELQHYEVLFGGKLTKITSANFAVGRRYYR